jgi:branched-chain amino acid transport system substrate-binding protein
MPLSRRSVLAFAVAAAVVCAAATGALGTATARSAGSVPTVKIVSDLPLHGQDSSITRQMVRAIRFVLAQAGYRAGKYRVEFESVDNTTPTRHEWDERTCERNAHAYASDPAVVGVIGAFNSGCSAIEIPILNRAPVAIVSPSNTYAGLTKSVVGTEPGEPARYYPAGGRNYTRMVASEDNEGRIGAMLMKETLGVKRVFVLNDGSDYGRMNGATFEQTAKKLGLEIVGHDAWARHRKSYTELMTRIEVTGADGLFVAGDLDKSAGRMLKDKAAVLGGSTQVKVVVSDGFVYDELFRFAGASAVEGIVGTAPIAPGRRVPAAASFVRAFGKTQRSRYLSDWTVPAAAATQVLLDAIARSDGTRKDVVAKLFATNRLSTVLGPISFDGNGDPKWAIEALYKAKGGHWVYIGSRTYESQVKPGRVARGEAATAAKTRQKAREAWFAPSLPRADRFTGESVRHTGLSDAAYALSKLIGKPKTVNVACWSNRDWPTVAQEDDDVYATYGIWIWDMPHWLHLSPDTCRAFETLLHHRPAYPNVYTADAVDTLTHELMHALGVDGEAQAECYALQLSVDLARQLGVPGHYAMRLAHLNLENYADLAPEYIDRTRCREDGVWDLARGKPSPPWHGA